MARASVDAPMAEPPFPEPGARLAFFLDIDGTLAPLAPTPQSAVLPAGTLALIGRLQARAAGALALVSGRALADIDRLFVPLVLPAAALHGLERRRADGTVAEVPVAPAGLGPVRAALAAFAATRPGVLLEDKGRSIALHYRLAPEAEPGVLALARRLAAESPESLKLIEGHKIAELLPRGTDKGRAIGAFLAEPPFRGRRPVFIGDDATDEDAFRALAQSDALTIRVTSPDAPADPTAARYRLPSVAAVHDWLAKVAAALVPAAGASPHGRALA